MGIDSIKSKLLSNLGGAAPAETTTHQVEAPLEHKVPAAPTEAFDAAKKKLVSVSGTQRAFKPDLGESSELKDLINSQRSLLNAGGGTRVSLKDGTLDSAGAKGADPAKRDPAHDFAAQAKKAHPKATPAQLEAEACKLAKGKLEKDFGVHVKNGDKKWTAEELTRTYESFSSMPTGDRENLKGLDLIRNARASPESQQEMGDKGTVAGEYQPNVKTTDGKRDKNGAIELYDAAFPTGPGSRKASIHVITHEAGHAVEGRKVDDKMFAYNSAHDKAKAASTAFNDATKANNQSIGELNAAGGRFGGVSGKDKEGMAFLKAEKAVVTATKKLGNAKTTDEIDQAQTALDAAKAKRDVALGAMSGHKKESAARDLVAASDQHEKTSRVRAETHAKSIPAKAAETAALKDLKSVSTVKEKVVRGEKVLVSTSHELESFKKARGKEKPVSGYGKSATGEGYAEAYALYQRDPAFMQQNYPKQYDYFHKHHQSPAD